MLSLNFQITPRHLFKEIVPMRSRAGAVRISLAANDEMSYSCRPLFSACAIDEPNSCESLVVAP